VDVVWFVLFVGGLIGLWFLAYRIEPHWSTRDGQRFVCNAQEIADGKALERMRETQVAVLPDGSLHVSRKRMMRRNGSIWRLVGRVDDGHGKVVVYLARQVSDGAMQAVDLALRIPRRSRCVPVLDGLLDRPAGSGAASAAG
jgi:hypothetical protein